MQTLEIFANESKHSFEKMACITGMKEPLYGDTFYTFLKKEGISPIFKRCTT